MRRTVLLRAGGSRSFSSVQWGLLAAASFTLGAKSGEVPTLWFSIPFAIETEIRISLKGAKSFQEINSAGFSTRSRSVFSGPSVRFHSAS
jgi:hypothetical protein